MLLNPDDDDDPPVPSPHPVLLSPDGDPPDVVNPDDGDWAQLYDVDPPAPVCAQLHGSHPSPSGGSPFDGRPWASVQGGMGCSTWSWAVAWL